MPTKIKGYHQKYMAYQRAKEKSLTSLTWKEWQEESLTNEQNVKPNSENVKPAKSLTDNFVKPEKVLNLELVKPLEAVKPPQDVKPCLRCPELATKIKELEQPNPTIELWKGRYFDLEKENNEKLKERSQLVEQQSETILRLKEKLKDLTNKKKDWEQRSLDGFNKPSIKYSNLKNDSEKQSPSPTKVPLSSIPPQATFTPLLFDKKQNKLITYSCPSPCWENKYCINCLKYNEICQKTLKTSPANLALND